MGLMNYITGLTRETPKTIQLDAGAVIKNIDIASATTVEQVKAILASILKRETSAKGELLGATKGGSTLKMVPTVRNLDADGMREPIVGSELVDEWDISLTTTLLEIRESTLSLALPMLEWSGVSGMREAKLRRNLRESDYLDNVAWCGNTGFGMMLVVFDNALHTGGLSMAVQDKGNGTIPLELRAHSAGYSFEEDYLPVQIYLLTETDAAAAIGA